MFHDWIIAALYSRRKSTCCWNSFVLSIFSGTERQVGWVRGERRRREEEKPSQDVTFKVRRSSKGERAVVKG
jgi:hypothetical protein